MRKKKGFTLVELLIVIAIIALLVAILMPALARIRRMALRIVCAANLRSIGQAMLVYSTDHDEQFPVAGDYWSYFVTWGWKNPAASTRTGGGTITSCLYLLVREADVPPEMFVCKSAADIVFTGQDLTATDPDILELWDFGDGKYKVGADISHRPCFRVSYSYQNPYGNYPIGPESSPSMAVLADRNPWLDWRLTYVTSTIDRNNYLDSVALIKSFCFDPQVLAANSRNHTREGQNVLFADIHASFEKRPDCGFNRDNIYTVWNPDPMDTPWGNKVDQCDEFIQVENQIGARMPAMGPKIPPGADAVGKEDSLMVGEHKCAG